MLFPKGELNPFYTGDENEPKFSKTLLHENKVEAERVGLVAKILDIDIDEQSKNISPTDQKEDGGQDKSFQFSSLKVALGSPVDNSVTGSGELLDDRNSNTNGVLPLSGNGRSNSINLSQNSGESCLTYRKVEESEILAAEESVVLVESIISDKALPNDSIRLTKKTRSLGKSKSVQDLTSTFDESLFDFLDDVSNLSDGEVVEEPSEPETTHFVTIRSPSKRVVMRSQSEENIQTPQRQGSTRRVRRVLRTASGRIVKRPAGLLNKDDPMKVSYSEQSVWLEKLVSDAVEKKKKQSEEEDTFRRTMSLPARPVLVATQRNDNVVNLVTSEERRAPVNEDVIEEKLELDRRREWLENLVKENANPAELSARRSSNPMLDEEPIVFQAEQIVESAPPTLDDARGVEFGDQAALNQPSGKVSATTGIRPEVNDTQRSSSFSTFANS